LRALSALPAMLALQPEHLPVLSALPALQPSYLPALLVLLSVLPAKLVPRLATYRCFQCSWRS